MLNDAEVKVAALLANSEEVTNKSKKTLKNLNNLYDLIALKMNAIIVKAFNLYQQISSPVLRIEEYVIVEDICFTKGWLNYKGGESTIVCGQTWDTLVQCKYVHLLVVCDKDAAKRWYMYRTVTIKNQHLAIKPFWKQVRELDNIAPTLACLKDTEICPMDVPADNVSMTGFEICTLLMCDVSDNCR